MKLVNHLSATALGVSVVWLGVARAASPEKPVDVTAQGTFSYGPVSGFLQTPAGGEPGTSTLKRPSLHELGIDDALFYEADLRLRWHRLCLEGGAQFIDLSESGTLPHTFVSRGSTFTAGEYFSTDNQFDWYRVSAGWQLDLSRRLTLVPKVEFVLLDFSYALSTSSQAVSRSYAKGGVRLGFDTVYALSELFSLSLDGGVALPLSNTPQIYSGLGQLHLHPFPSRWRLKPEVLLGVGFQRIDYEDNQTLPNHVRGDFGPFVNAGLGVSF